MIAMMTPTINRVHSYSAADWESFFIAVVGAAAALTGLPVETPEQMETAASMLLTLGAGAVVIKGGHLPGDELVDMLVTLDGVRHFPGRRIHTTSTHGTGCTLSSAIATGLAQGMELEDAVGTAIAYVRRAIETAPGYGQGHGPLNHGHTVPDRIG